MMAVTGNEEKNLQGMQYISKTPDECFRDIDEWQIVVFTYDRDATDAFFWDKEALQKRGKYWGNAVQVGLGNLDGCNSYVEASISRLEKIIPILSQVMLVVK